MQPNAARLTLSDTTRTAAISAENASAAREQRSRERPNATTARGSTADPPRQRSHVSHPRESEPRRRTELAAESAIFPPWRVLRDSAVSIAVKATNAPALQCSSIYPSLTAHWMGLCARPAFLFSCPGHILLFL